MTPGARASSDRVAARRGRGLDDTQRAAVIALLDAAEEQGSLCLHDVAALVARLELDDEAQGQIEETARTRGVDLTDDCGRDHVPATHYLNGDLATTTTDALSLFLREVRRHPLLTAAEEIELAKRIENGDEAARSG